MIKPFWRTASSAENAATLDNASNAMETQHLQISFITKMRPLERSLARLSEHTFLRIGCAERNVLVIEQIGSEAWTKRCSARSGWAASQLSMMSEWMLTTARTG